MTRFITILTTPIALSAMALLSACSGSSDTVEADVIYQNGYIYTADAKRRVAEAVAVRNGEIIFVGSNEGASDHIGDDTTVVDLEGHMMMPGLHDSHIHPIGIVALDVCDLDNQAVSLDELVAHIQACIARYAYPSGTPIAVHQWNPFVGNEPNANYDTIMEALDAVSTAHPIYLMGSDGHHGAANSTAFALAEDSDGNVVGINKTTLATEFATYTLNIGVDANGDPNGIIDETARALIDFPHILDADSALYDPVLPQIAAKLNSYGITSIQDAAASENTLSLLRTMADRDLMTFRTTAAIFLDWSEFATDDGINYDAAIAHLKEIRDSLADYPYLKADAVKFFADGVLEGNPYTSPPVLPNAAMLSRYEQPIFDLSELESDGIVTLTGYVDLDGAVCEDQRANPEDTDEPAEVEAFTLTHGFAPSQCTISFGQFEMDPEFMIEALPLLDENDFVVHIHAIGDAAVRAAVDAIVAAKENSSRDLPHSIAHLQVIHPDDQARMGEWGIYATYTYGWIWPEYYYDLTINPFVNQIASTEPDDLYDLDTYHMQNVYPVKATLDAGAVLTAGSDAPVDTREPTPFRHLGQGITRANDEGFQLNGSQAVDVHEMIAAYTINGARAMRQDDITGSIEKGKRADLIIIDQNIVELAENDEAWRIQDTQVLVTVFDGEVVYTAEEEAEE